MAFLRTVIRCSVHKKYGLLINNLQNGSFGKINVNQIVLKSSAASSTTIVDSKSSASVNNPPRDPLDITFEDAKAAFKSKTNLELIRAYVVYTLCSFETLVENNMKVSKVIGLYCITIIHNSNVAYVKRHLKVTYHKWTFRMSVQQIVGEFFSKEYS